MIVRRLEQNEKFEAGRIAGICFHARTEDLEKKRAEAEKNGDEMFGAFSDDGCLMGSIINNHFLFHLREREVTGGGIGAVSTLPEYREKGVIRAVFGELLPAARERGEVLSALYPFSHEFYRKFGYETVLRGTEYDFSPDQLRQYRSTEQARLWREGENTEAFTRIYHTWSRGLRLSLIRDDGRVRAEHVNGKYWLDRHFCYLFGGSGNENAYLVFDDIRHDPAAILSVREAAWCDREGFLSVLAFLGRFTADYGNVIWPMPTGIDLIPFFRDPYSVNVRPMRDYMLRVMNTERLLSCLAEGTGACFSLMVYGDEFLKQNNGVFRVEDKLVKREDTACPDITLSIHALAGLASGTRSLEETLLREDACVSGNRADLETVFKRDSVYVGDHF